MNVFMSITIIIIIIIIIIMIILYTVYVLWLEACAACKVCMRNLLGWLETRLAQSTLDYLKLA